jgi:hypothetical protein
MRSFVIIIIILITVVASYYFSQLRSWDYVVRGILIFHFVLLYTVCHDIW